ncbi:MAG: glycosyltransferase 87 family protein [Solirubrobacteraceae bacterium]
MRRVLRENALCALLATAGCAVTAWLSLYGFAWNDYDVEARPAFEALVQGRLHDFVALAPVYGGSLIERAPFALLPGLWHGGPLALYRMVALPGLLAAAGLGVWLLARMRAQGRPRLARAIILGLCVANPVTLLALEVGHSEELLGACMCAAAMLLACAPEVGRRRALATGLLLGLAIANKQWAILAAAPVLLALPPARRLAGLAAAIGAAVLVQAPLLMSASSGFVAGVHNAATPPSSVFQPWQVWWFLGHHGSLVHGLFGAAKPGYRIGPAWVGTVSHPLVLVLGGAFALALWSRSRRSRLAAEQAMIALALTLLARCLLDTWDTAYYMLGPIFALIVWESRREGPQPPVLALSVSVLVWAGFQWLPGRVSPDLQSLAFLAWSLPLTGWLALRLRRPPGAPAHLPGATDAATATACQPITVSSLGRPVRTSQPSARTTVRSSMRTPSASGR